MPPKSMDQLQKPRRSMQKVLNQLKEAERKILVPFAASPQGLTDPVPEEVLDACKNLEIVFVWTNKLKPLAQQELAKRAHPYVRPRARRQNFA